MSGKLHFKLSSSAIGFDLDHTVARYTPQLASQVTWAFAKFLHEERGYPADLGDEKLLPQLDFAQRGIVFDKKHGNLLQVDEHKHVTLIYHGSRQIPILKKNEEEKNRDQNGENQNGDDVADANASAHVEELVKEEEESLQGTHIYPGPINEFDARAKEFHHKDRFHSFLTGFDFPLLRLVARMVDLIDDGLLSEQVSGENRYEKAFSDLIDGFGFFHSPGDRGYHYLPLHMDIKPFLYQRDQIKAWLHKLRENGIPTFLVSNAEYNYCSRVAAGSLGDDWAKDFDLVVCAAKKPRFFSGDDPFCEVNPITHELGPPISTIQFGKIYAFGNAKEVERLMATRTQDGPTPRKMIYCGDNLLTDVMATKLHTDWFPITIMDDIEQVVIPEQPINGGRGIKRKLANGTTPHENGSEKEDGRHHTITKRPKSEVWGSFFTASNGERSYWHRFIMLHSALAISDLAILTHFPLDNQFDVQYGANSCFYPTVNPGN